jgi:ABC-type branched-subunit amino acid transport system ATPase component
MLTLQDVTAGYDTFQALFDVSLEVRSGKAVAVIGPNGAGKTTLLRVISKLIDATEGEIRFDGRLLNDVPAHHRSAVRSSTLGRRSSGRRMALRFSLWRRRTPGRRRC